MILTVWRDSLTCPNTGQYVLAQVGISNLIFDISQLIYVEPERIQWWKYATKRRSQQLSPSNIQHKLILSIFKLQVSAAW